MTSMLYRQILKPLLFQLDPEQAHHFAMFWLRGAARSRWVLEALRSKNNPQLARTVFGLQFPNPLGLAAGFDKNALALPAWEALGFGFVEIGTITARPQPGNPRPRIFRVPEQRALINRMGFNNDGAAALATRLQEWRDASRWPRGPVGINIGKTKLTPLEDATGDYLTSFNALFAHADYFVLNVSSPNTPGLRSLQNKDALTELLAAIQYRNAELGGRDRKPVLVKIAPDLEWSQIDEIVELALAHGLAGIVATNTTIDHSSVPESLREQGGLSGRPLQARSTEIVRFITGRTALPVIAVGGIHDLASAQEKFDAGAALIQLYTAFIYEGPSLLPRILDGLTRPAAQPLAAPHEPTR